MTTHNAHNPNCSCLITYLYLGRLNFKHLLADEPATGISPGTSGERSLVADGTGSGGGGGHGTSYPLYKHIYHENINTMTQTSNRPNQPYQPTT